MPPDPPNVDHHHVLAALAGPRRHRYHDPVASSGIFEAVLLVLVAAELVPAAPALLIPIRFDQATAFDTVAGGQRLAITAKQPSRFGMINPNPCRPEYGGEERLSVPRWNVDNQVAEAAFGDSLQVLAYGLHVHALDERRGRFEQRPRLQHELMQLSSGLLRFQVKAAQHPPPRGWGRVAGGGCGGERCSFLLAFSVFR